MAPRRNIMEQRGQPFRIRGVRDHQRHQRQRGHDGGTVLRFPSSGGSRCVQAFAMAGLLLVAACGSDSVDPSLTQTSVSTTQEVASPKGVWVVLEAGGRPVPEGAVLTITQETVVGAVYCNGYGAGLDSTSDGFFRVSNPEVEDEECVPAESEAQAAVVGFLGRATNWGLSDDGNSLSLSSEQDEVLLLERK